MKGMFFPLHMIFDKSIIFFEVGYPVLHILCYVIYVCALQVPYLNYVTTYLF